MKWRRAETGGGERGATIIEFALLSSVMFVMLFGILSYGEVLADYVQLRHRVGEISRLVALGEDGPDRQAIFVEERNKIMGGFFVNKPNCLRFTTPAFTGPNIIIEMVYDYGENGECRIMPEVPFLFPPQTITVRNAFTVRN
ncbi:TadE/TadG family type IV pilus assembly protein [Zavarzinia compransoris]|uniref:TadE-like domain-containing protein n=1 Tax=Zavarzinia compransoris TaxID=1264899 RepID=A0A317E7Y3_9PROT|nr:TadE/TadG family type IV pilus assembly protein [Zavarzinia compransoris]PWR22366.1 hypothetical protein DKG75_10475 [Zavarzinia compransoris]TDP46866.1 TadE-like protein [Zavarzinia compransoris]